MGRVMTLNEAWDMTYDEYVQYLLNKYGGAKHDYFWTRECRSKSNVTRGNEGLECHHIDEDKHILLCEPLFARMHWETQTADRLVYADKIEHILLHIKIANMGTAGDYMCGTRFLIGSTNSLYDYPPTERDLKPNERWKLPTYERIKDNFELYIEVLHRLSQILYEQNDSERALVREKKMNIEETTAYRVIFATDPNSKNNALPKKVYDAFINHVSKDNYQFSEVLEQQISIQDLLE